MWKRSGGQPGSADESIRRLFRQCCAAPQDHRIGRSVRWSHGGPRRVGRLCLIATGCASADDDPGAGRAPTPPAVVASSEPATTTATVDTSEYAYPDAPAAVRPGTAAATAAITSIVEDVSRGGTTASRLDELVAAGDARHAWLISDLLRFTADQGELDHAWRPTRG